MSLYTRTELRIIQQFAFVPTILNDIWLPVPLKNVLRMAYNSS